MVEKLPHDVELAKDIVSQDGWMSLVCASQLGSLSKSKSAVDFAIGHMNKDLEYFRASNSMFDSDLTTSVVKLFKRAQLLHDFGADFSVVLQRERGDE